MPTATPSGKIACSAEDCPNKDTARPWGSKTCIDYLCKTCCIRKYEATCAQNLRRLKCSAHSQNEVKSTTTAPILPPLAAAPASSHPLPQSQASPAPPTATHIPVPTSSTEPASRSRSLAQPLNPEWANSYAKAVDNRVISKGHKQLQQDLENRRRSTSTLVVWYKVRWRVSVLVVFYSQSALLEWCTTSQAHTFCRHLAQFHDFVCPSTCERCRLDGWVKG